MVAFLLIVLDIVRKRERVNWCSSFPAWRATVEEERIGGEEVDAEGVGRLLSFMGMGRRGGEGKSREVVYPRAVHSCLLQAW